MLSTLSQLPEVQKRDIEACQALFRRLHEQYPFYSIISGATPEGDVFADSNPDKPSRVSLADRKHVKDAIRTLDFSAGEYIVGRTSRVPSINFTYPILNEGKNLTGVLVAGFRLDEYAHFIDKANLSEGSAFVIADHMGVRLYRFPENEGAPLGKPIPRNGFERISGKAKAGVYEDRGADGAYRIYAFKQMRLREDLSPYLYMIGGIAKDVILQQANRVMLGSLSILGIIALGALALAWAFGNRFVADLINQLLRVTKQLASGDMEVRTGVPHGSDELGQLAKSFDEMASQLEMGRAEQRKAEDALRESERFNRSTVNALPANLAILDENGFILCTNRSWQEFAKTNGLACDPELTGVNYLRVCGHASGEWAEEAPIAASGIRDVIAGRRDTWQMDYPLPLPLSQREALVHHAG